MQRRPVAFLLVLSILPLIQIYALSRVGAHLRYSFFYQLNATAHDEEEALRRRASVLHLNDLLEHGWRVPTPPPDARPLICIALISTGSRTHELRARERYVLQAASSLLSNIAAKDWRDVSLYLVAPRDDGGNADTLRRLIPSVELPRRDVQQTNKLEWNVAQYDDFLSALTHCASVAPYALLLEDDVVAARNFLSALRSIIAKLDGDGDGGAVRKRRDWAFVKLWFTEFWLGWGNDTLHTLVLLAALAGTLTYLLLRFWRWPHRSALALALYVAALVVLTLLLVGRQHVFSYPPGLREFDTGCCTPATLFNRRQAPRLVAYLRHYLTHHDRNQTVPHDVMISHAARDLGLRMLHYTPHLFQHIGRISSSMSKVNPAWDTMKQSLSFPG